MTKSFIIPAHNEQKYIGSLLESIEKYATPDLLEIIVVNNACTDGTAKVAQAFPKVRVVDEPRKGLVFARAAGARAAKGDILAHVDADCILPENWFSVVKKEFEKDGKLVALSGPYIYYDFKVLQKLEVKFFYYITFFIYLLNRYVFRLGSMLQGGNIVVKKLAWDRIGAADEAFNFYGEDADLARRLHKVGKVKFTFKLPMFTSGRRLLKDGIARVGLRYSMNYFSVMLRKKPAHTTYNDIR